MIDKEDKLCTESGCGNGSICKRMCQRHYDLWRRLLNPNANVCVIEMCDNKATHRTMCSMHYASQKREESRSINICIGSGCKNTPKKGKDSCNSCLKRVKLSNLKLNYGITVEEYNQKFMKQRGLCNICGKVKSLCVDHNHTTQKVRDLLCSSCNKLLGYAYEDPEILLSATKYLERHENE